MFVYILLILGFISYVLYNQKVIPKSIKEKNDLLIYVPGLMEGVVFALTSSGFMVPFIFISGMFFHWKNFSNVQKFKSEHIKWVTKNLIIRSVLIYITYLIVYFLFVA